MKKLQKGASYCASCFGQYTDREYVDLEAYFDGPVIDSFNGLKQPIDDLILCETCLKEAAQLIGLGYAKDLRNENRELGVALEKKDDIITAKDKQINDLIHSLESVRKNPPKKSVGRPKLIMETG